MNKVTSAELSSEVRFRIEVRIQFRKRIKARVRFENGERVWDGGHSQELG